MKATQYWLAFRESMALTVTLGHWWHGWRERRRLTHDFELTCTKAKYKHYIALTLFPYLALLLYLQMGDFMTIFLP